MEYSKWIHDYRMKHSKENNNIRTNALACDDTKYIQFTVNPYKRAVSSYIHSVRCNTININEVSFKEFLNALKDGVESNIHYDKQTFFKKDITIEKFKLENIDNILPYINEKYGLDYKINDTISHSGHYAKKNNNNNFVGNTKWNELKNNIPKNYTLFYDNEIKSLVDFLILKYIIL
jgi:hypothetical protein